MPLYSFLCNKGHKFELVLKVAEYNLPQTCECGEKAKRQVTTAMITPAFEDYESPIDGSPITSKKKRIEDMARNDCVPYESSLRQESTRNMKVEEAALEKAVDETVEREISKMPSDKRLSLEKELAAGANLEYHRGASQ